MKQCKFCGTKITREQRCAYRMQVTVPNQIDALGESVLLGRKVHRSYSLCSLNCVEAFAHANAMNNNGDIKACN